MARTIKPNQNDKTLVRKATQSYIMTAARFKYNLTEERIRNALLDNLWRLTGETKGVILKNSMFRLHKPDNSRSWEVEMPVADIIKYMGNTDDPSKNYDLIKRAAKKMMVKIIEVENTETGDWWAASLIQNVYISKRSGIMKFQVADWVMTALLDISKGFTQYELGSMQSLKHASTMRAYEMVSNAKKDCLSWTFENLKEFFFGRAETKKEKNKYSSLYDFERRVLKPAKKELDDSNCPWSFDYQIIKKAGKDGKIARNAKVEKINIYPIHRPQLENQSIITNNALAQLPAGGKFGVLKPELYDYLLHNLDWSKETIAKNKQTFAKAQEVMDLTELLSKLAKMGAAARKVDNPIGYVINGVKGEIEKHGVKKEAAPAPAASSTVRSPRDIASIIAEQFKTK